MRTLFAVLAGFAIAVLCVFAAGCSSSSDPDYTCEYERRSSACGGGNYGPWEYECYEYNMDDYVDGYTPEQVCDNFTGTDTHCAGGCCIYVEYRNTVLHDGHVCSSSSMFM